MTALIGHHLGGYHLGGYHLEEEVGRGAMGIVYRGRQVALERDVAVKVFSQPLTPDPSFVIRFLREARILAELNHPHIVQIFDAGRQEEVLYFVMEYVQGPTLRNLLRLDGKMPAYLATEYIAQAADALDVASTEYHIIHRDLKPENLMLDRWGRLKVMDFGLARVPGLLEITEAQTLVGSLSYASPEQLLSLPLDHRSDIYTLGIVLYELLTGSLPFAGETLQDAVQAIITGQLVSPRAFLADVPPELEQILFTAMASNRDERFAHAGLMAKALRALPFARTHAEPPRHPLGTVLPVEEGPSVGTAHRLPANLPEPRPYTPIIASRLTLPMRLQPMDAPESQPSQDG
ncbi:MAG TPA: serine/threonine-protein kinase [Ktedonobacteraceae bacterium]|nr:serine/threonine-protein kinase [Ktedonobacteraceae bacterium]